jgi:hypothetical protein
MSGYVTKVTAQMAFIYIPEKGERRIMKRNVSPFPEHGKRTRDVAPLQNWVQLTGSFTGRMEHFTRYPPFLNPTNRK